MGEEKGDGDGAGTIKRLAASGGYVLACLALGLTLCVWVCVCVCVCVCLYMALGVCWLGLRQSDMDPQALVDKVSKTGKDTRIWDM